MLVQLNDKKCLGNCVAAVVSVGCPCGQMTDLQHVLVWYELGFVGQVR